MQRGLYTHMHEDPPQGPSIAAYKGCSQGMQTECALDNLRFWEHIYTNADWITHCADTLLLKIVQMITSLE